MTKMTHQTEVNQRATQEAPAPTRAAAERRVRPAPPHPARFALRRLRLLLRSATSTVRLMVGWSNRKERSVPATDMSATSPLGVGVSRSRQGNERALNKDEETRRKDREEPGIGPPRTIHRESPISVRGDQPG